MRYAFVSAQTRTLERSMSRKSWRSAGSGLIISSSGSDPSHFWSKSRGSAAAVSRGAKQAGRRAGGGGRESGFTYVVMAREAAQREAVLRVVFVVQVGGFFVGEAEGEEVRCGRIARYTRVEMAGDVGRTVNARAHRLRDLGARRVERVVDVKEDNEPVICPGELSALGAHGIDATLCLVRGHLGQ